MDLYTGKAAMLRRLTPLVDSVAHAGISPDALTVASLPVAVAGAAVLLVSPAAPPLLLAIPVLAGARLILNLLDGAVARRTGQQHPRGEVLNEVCDRLADVALLAPVAVLPGASTTIVLLGVIAAVVASDVGVAAKSAGGGRLYRGILSKPGRMVLVSVASVGYLATGPGAWTVFGPLLLGGAVLTLLERLRLALRLP